MHVAFYLSAASICLACRFARDFIRRRCYFVRNVVRRSSFERRAGDYDELQIRLLNEPLVVAIAAPCLHYNERLAS